MNSFLCSSREYNLCLPRREVEEVDNLRDEWIKLMELAEKVSHGHDTLPGHPSLDVYCQKLRFPLF